MTGRPTAGDFLRAAGEQLRLSRLAPPPARRAEADEISRVLGQLMTVLARHLADVAPVGILEIRDAPDIGGWPRAVLEAHDALTTGIRSLQGGRRRPALASGDSELARRLASAALSLTTARDLLQGHFTPDRHYASEWAPVIASPPALRALAAEVSSCARQAAPLAVKLAQSCSARRGVLAEVGRRLATAGQSLWAADYAIQAAHLQEPARAADRELLHAIPLNSPPPKVMPHGTEDLTALCQGVMITAERVRHATWETRPAWSPDTCDTSLRHTAASGVVISDNCATALEALAARADDLGLAGFSAALAESAGAAAAEARAWWLAAARAWGTQVVTDTTGKATPVCDEAGDLAVWTGRLVYIDPQWTPVHGRNHALRPPAELTRTAGDVGQVVAAVHSAAETLDRMAKAEARQVRAVAAMSRLHSATRSLPARMDIPRPYGPAPGLRVEALVDAYRGAGIASARLVAGAWEIAAAVGAPSHLLAAARAAVGRAPEPPPPRGLEDVESARWPATGARSGEFTPSDVRAIVTGYDTGASLREIGEWHGTSAWKIRGLLDRENVPIRPRGAQAGRAQRNRAARASPTPAAGNVPAPPARAPDPPAAMRQVPEQADAGPVVRLLREMGITGADLLRRAAALDQEAGLAAKMGNTAARPARGPEALP